MNRLALALAASMTALMSQAVKAEPQVLTAPQMDQVTAGEVYVDVISLAAAEGDFARALTYTRTGLVTTRWTEAGFGVGMGSALACCGSDAQVDVASVGVGEAARVLGRTHGVERHSPRFAYAVSVVTVVAISRMTPAEILQDLWDMGRMQPAAR